MRDAGVRVLGQAFCLCGGVALSLSLCACVLEMAKSKVRDAAFDASKIPPFANSPFLLERVQNHTNHNQVRRCEPSLLSSLADPSHHLSQNKKAHRNGIKKPQAHKYSKTKGVSEHAEMPCCMHVVCEWHACVPYPHNDPLRAPLQMDPKFLRNQVRGLGTHARCLMGAPASCVLFGWSQRLRGLSLTFLPTTPILMRRGTPRSTTRSRARIHELCLR